MNVSQTRSSFEAKLAAAHRMAYYAAEHADELGYRGAVHKLHEIMADLTYLTHDSVSSTPSALARLKHIHDDVPF